MLGKISVTLKEGCTTLIWTDDILGEPFVIFAMSSSNLIYWE